MLHTLLGAHTPTIGERIEAIVDESGIDEAFTVNLAAVLTRELRLHRELPDGPIRQTRLPAVETAWTLARTRLYRHIARRT